MKKAILLNSLIFVSAIIAIFFRQDEQVLFYGSFKGLTTLLIILIPLLYSNLKSQYTRMILCGLSFSLLGDLFLVGDSFFIFGLSSFLIAHVLFTLAFTSVNGFTAFLKSLLPILLYGTVYFAYLYGSLENMKIPVLVYILAILVMVWQGINLFLIDQTTANLLVLIAVLLFMISDSILAFDKFKSPFESAGIFILLTYWASITLLANSTTITEDDHPSL